MALEKINHDSGIGSDGPKRLSQPSLSGVVDAIIEVGRQRKKILECMRVALESGDKETALTQARELCGLSDEKSDRTDTSVH